MEFLLDEGRLVRRDIEQVYAGLYLDAITSFEHFIEHLFIGLIVQSIIPASLKIIPRITFKSYGVACDVVFGGKNYVDWLPYTYTEKRAKVFFRNGFPFTQLEKIDKNRLEQIMYIRNAIAHKSKYSLEKFEKEVIGSLPLNPRERTPTGFLRSIFRITPRQTRFENLVGDMAEISRKLCK